MKKEAEERNYYQLERDKIMTFWEITKKDLEDTQAQLRNRDRQMEELEEKTAVEIKVYKQKVKHLQYEHQNNVTLLKTDNEMTTKLQEDEHRNREAELKKDKRSLKVEIKESQLANEDVIRNLKLDQDKAMTRLRQEHERHLKELQARFDQEVSTLRDELEVRRKMETLEIEERKNLHINELMKKHERAFSEIKSFYNEIVNNNLDLIRTLKDELAELKKKEATNERLMFEIAQENRRLSEPLERALKEVDQLRHELSNYQKDKLSLQNAKARLVVQDDLLKSLRWEHEVLEQKFAQVQTERDTLYERFEGAIYDVQQKAGLKNIMLEKKLADVSERLESKDSQLNEVLAKSDLDPAAKAQVGRRLQEVLDSKNGAIKDLQFELARVSKAHDDLLRVYSAKLSEYGIPAEELGFRPVGKAQHA
jgi:hypothetical protein